MLFPSGRARPSTPLSTSSVRFASFLLYPGRGTADVSDVARYAKQVGLAMKLDRVSPEPGTPMIRYAARRLRQNFPAEQRQEFLAGDVVLVPAPGSSLRKPDTLWVPQRLCEALVAEGLGSRVLLALERHTAVPKSAFCSPGERPSVQKHYETIRAHATLPAPARLCIVDDITTKGATLFACASRLKEAFPDAEVVVFGMAKTMPFRAEHTRIDQPQTGTIRLNRWAGTTCDQTWTAWSIEPTPEGQDDL